MQWRIEHEKTVAILSAYFGEQIDYNTASTRLSGLGYSWEEAVDMLSE